MFRSSITGASELLPLPTKISFTINHDAHVRRERPRDVYNPYRVSSTRPRFCHIVLGGVETWPAVGRVAFSAFETTIHSRTFEMNFWLRFAGKTRSLLVLGACVHLENHTAGSFVSTALTAWTALHCFSFVGSFVRRAENLVENTGRLV